MQGDALHVLLVELSPAAVADVRRGLELERPPTIGTVAVPDRAAALARLEAESFDALVLDLTTTASLGLDAIVAVLERRPELPVLVIVPDGDDEAYGPAAIRLGAEDYVLRSALATPILAHALRHAVRRSAAAHARMRGESERRLQGITEGIPGAVYQFRLSPTGVHTFSFLSAGIRGLTGLAAEAVEADANRLWALVLPDDLAALQNSLQTSARALRPWLLEFRLTTSDGTVKWIRGSAVPAREADGGTLWNGILMDMSEHRHLEEQLRQAQKMEAIGQLAGGVAHDFNNLLTAIGSSADMALDQLGEPAALRDHLAEIQRAAVRAADLTRQLLAFSRRQVLHLESVSLADVVVEGERMLRRIIGESIRLETAVDPDTPAVRADRSQLAQVLMNLAVNARDAMPSGGALTLATRHRVVGAAEARRTRGLSAGAYSLLIVRDSGVGMDEATRARVFEPFFTTKDAGKGTGLGLSMVYGIVKQTGGYIQVDTALGRGTTFTIHLPVAAAPATRAKASASRRARPRGTETVLVAEDEPGVRAPVRRILTAHGYNVLEAPDGAEALKIAEGHEGQIDLLLTDVVMPGMNGGELARRLRRLRTGIRVVFMSGYSTEAVATHGVLSPGAAFLQKPFSVEELVGRLRDVLDGGEA